MTKLLIGCTAIKMGAHPQKATGILDILHKVEMMK